MKSKSTETKPSIVFCHGIWADGSCFNKVIPTLQADGHQVIAAQYGLDTLLLLVLRLKLLLAFHLLFGELLIVWNLDRPSIRRMQK